MDIFYCVDSSWENTKEDCNNATHLQCLKFKSCNHYFLYRDVYFWECIDPTATIKMYWAGFCAFKSPPIKNAIGWLCASKSPYINAYRVDSNFIVNVPLIFNVMSVNDPKVSFR